MIKETRTTSATRAEQRVLQTRQNKRIRILFRAYPRFTVISFSFEFRSGSSFLIFLLLVGAVVPLKFLGNVDLHTVLIFTGNVDLLTLHVKLEAGRELKFPILLGPEVNNQISKLRIHM